MANQGGLEAFEKKKSFNSKNSKVFIRNLKTKSSEFFNL